MRLGLTSRCFALALCGLLARAALAEDDRSYCIVRRTSDLDRDQMLDAARAVARPRRIAPDTFTYCSRRRLAGRFDWAMVETVHRELPDGSESWLLVSCERRHGQSRWPCTGYEKRAVRVEIEEAGKRRSRAVEVLYAQPSVPVDAAVIGTLVARAFEIAANPETLMTCDTPANGPADPPHWFTKAWKAGGDLSAWFDGEKAAGVSRKDGPTLEFSKKAGTADEFELPCWREQVLVTE